jgi:hypothetical protein
MTSIRVVLLSSRHDVRITVDGAPVLEQHTAGNADDGRGLHLVVVDGASGRVTSRKVRFDSCHQDWTMDS